MKFRTIPEMFYNTVEIMSDRAVLHDRGEGGWLGITYRELKDRVESFAYGMASLGVKKGDKIAILSTNSSKWAISDYAIAGLGAVSVTIYPTLTSSQMKYIIKHSDTKFILTENREQTQKVMEFMDSLPELLGVIVMDDSLKERDNIFHFSRIIEEGRGFREKADFDFKERALRVEPDDLLTLVYTSGTTGNPKGVMLTHKNLVSNVIGARKAIPPVGPEDRVLSFLPLSHCFERMVGHYGPFSAGCSIYYAEGIDELAKNMGEVKPTIMASVPRLFEKIHAKVVDKVMSDSALRQKIFNWALGVGIQSTHYLQRSRKPRGLLGLKFALANKLVFSKLKARVGGKLRYFFSGGAPLSSEVGEFFTAADIPILEGYGLTETSPVITVNRGNLFKIGTVGLPLAGVETEIGDDGEILCRGDNVMKGYYKNPEATSESIDSDGWFHTGDIGFFDVDGYLKITDRKKNLIVTSCGKNVAPVPLEKALSASKFVEQCLVLGNNRKFISCLIVPAFNALEEWGKTEGLSTEDREKLCKNKKVTGLYGEILESAMKGFANYERVKKFALVPEEWTIENDALTPTLKTKRRVIENRCQGLIEDIYKC